MCGTGCNFDSIVIKICVSLPNGPGTNEFQHVHVGPIAPMI